MKKIHTAKKATAYEIRKALHITKETSDDIQKLLEHLFPKKFRRKGKGDPK